MTSALYEMVMDNPMAMMGADDLADPVPLEAHECPSCRAVWEKWTEMDDWEHDQSILTLTHEDPMAECCCPACAVRSASRDLLISYCEQADIRGRVMGYAMTHDGEGVVEQDYEDLLWGVVTRQPDNDLIWGYVRDYINEYHAEAFFRWRQEAGV